MLPRNLGRPLIRQQSGQVMVHMALVMTVFFGLIGAGIDWGRVIIEDTRIQQASDAVTDGEELWVRLLKVDLARRRMAFSLRVPIPENA